MKGIITTTFVLGISAITTLNAQIGIKKPTVNIEKPKVEIGNGKTTASDVGLGGKDASGLFKNVTTDPSAEMHRKNAVANLNTLEEEYKKSTVDYTMLTKLIFENERTLGHITKLEPKVDAEKYYEKYQPLKDRADKENAIYADVKKLEDLFQKEFNAKTEFKKPDPLNFRSDSYSGQKQCYCRNYSSETKTYAEYNDAKTKYMELTNQLVGYKNDNTQTILSNNTVCLENGNKYAVWASTENLAVAVEKYNSDKKESDPKKVILRCDDYIKALERIESDYSLNLSSEAKTALADGKKKTTAIKTDAELYISSGKYQVYLDKVYAEKIAKVFMPKAVTKNATLETGAMAYVKGQEYNDYLKNRVKESEVATTLRAVTLTKEPYVKKNEYGIPLYQYHEMWVAYKGKDGKCYLTAVYASYTYKGGGTYATVPTWGADAPDEMACENVNK